MPPAITPKKRHQLEPITYDELLSNAGMSGFVSFLEFPAPPAAPAEAPPPDPAPVPTIVKAQPRQPRPARQGRIRKAAAAEDGHSLAEQAVYTALWRAANPVSEAVNADRTIRIGYHRLAHMTRLSWVSVKTNLRTLEKKLALEVIGSENSATREGKRYLVYSPPSILERRKKAGLEWVRRTRGVELLTRA
ncbi:MAG TPA: hypothetical protein VMO17_11365 [Terriglobia bacterium]|nr:hypothetical protein [Terriglobia bacterium]